MIDGIMPHKHNIVIEQCWNSIRNWLFNLSPDSFQSLSLFCSKVYKLIQLTVFDLITAHTPISAQSSNITASIFSLYVFTKAYVVGTHLNCIDLMQFK